MSGTQLGGLRAAATNKLLYGEDFYKRNGATGGKHGTGHKFAHGKVDPSEMGARGGAISRRTGVKNGQGKPRAKKAAPIQKPKWYQFTKKRILKRLKAA